jgi:ribosomal-protein-alanine N-acetyltransferase
VVEKLGFREEGLRPRYLHIDGAWRDHLVFALTAEELPEGLLARWHRARRQQTGTPSPGSRARGASADPS